MSTPRDDFKSVRIPRELHARLAALQDDLPGVNSIWQTIEFLMSKQCVRVAVTGGVRDRWQSVADMNGMNLGDWITARVEGSLLYGADRGSLELIYRLTREMHHHLMGPEQMPNPGPRSIKNQ